MRYGLPDQIVQAIINELGKHEVIKKAVLFGSRARGDYKHNSDIDLAIDCEGELPPGLYADLDEVAGIYKIDIVKMHGINNKELLKSIEREGIAIFPASNES